MECFYCGKPMAKTNFQDCKKNPAGMCIPKEFMDVGSHSSTE